MKLVQTGRVNRVGMRDPRVAGGDKQVHDLIRVAGVPADHAAVPSES